MFKKIFCLALALVMMLSVAAIGFSAAEADVAAAGADEDAATTGADADVATTGLDASKCLNFDVNSFGWKNFGKIGFYICLVGGDPWKAWGSSALFKSEETSDGIWSFDPEANGVGLEDGKQYFVIFVGKDSGAQTANLLFDTSCIGDTAIATGKKLENDVDSHKTSEEAKWTKSSLGSMKVITSIGNVVGETIPANTSATEMFTKFLTDTLTNARKYADTSLYPTDQELLDHVGKELGLNKDQVDQCIKDSGVSDIAWSKDKSTLPAGEGSNTTTETTAEKTTTTTTTSSTKTTGSASNTQTGQTEDMIFIMLGVMVLAAGVIFFARKKSRA